MIELRWKQKVEGEPYGTLQMRKYISLPIVDESGIINLDYEWTEWEDVPIVIED